MIKLQGCVDQNYMVLGLGRSGMASAGALTASGANVICWDDDEEKRSLASSKGFQIKSSSSDFDWQSIERLIISPGIPHHFPLPHPIIAAAIAADRYEQAAVHWNAKRVDGTSHACYAPHSAEKAPQHFFRFSCINR